MMAFTRDGQLKEGLVADRDRCGDMPLARQADSCTAQQCTIARLAADHIPIHGLHLMPVLMPVE